MSKPYYDLSPEERDELIDYEDTFEDDEEDDYDER